MSVGSTANGQMHSAPSTHAAFLLVPGAIVMQSGSMQVSPSAYIQHNKFEIQTCSTSAQGLKMTSTPCLMCASLGAIRQRKNGGSDDRYCQMQIPTPYQEVWGGLSFSLSCANTHPVCVRYRSQRLGVSGKDSRCYLVFPEVGIKCRHG